MGVNGDAEGEGGGGGAVSEGPRPLGVRRRVGRAGAFVRPGAATAAVALPLPPRVLGASAARPPMLRQLRLRPHEGGGAYFRPRQRGSRCCSYYGTVYDHIEAKNAKKRS